MAEVLLWAQVEVVKQCPGFRPKQKAALIEIAEQQQNATEVRATAGGAAKATC